MTRLLRKLAESIIRTYVRYSPISRGKFRLIEVIGRRMADGTFATTALKDAPIRLSLDRSRFLQRQLYYWGEYERESIAEWRHRSTTAKTIVDVGAHVGLYSLIAASANPRATVHAFEPTAELASRFA